MEKPVIGDYIIFDYNSSGVSIIKEILERKSIFKRPDQSGHATGYVKTMKEQILAANFDYVFITVSLNKNFNINRITRYISVTLQGGAKPVVILTKADLCDNKEEYIEQVRKISNDVDVFALSALSGEGMSNLNSYLNEGTTIVFLGSSGVGKSTLINTISGKDIMKVSAIRESDSKGHHTTTHRQLITLPSGVTIIDCPGIREIGMCDVEKGIDDTFQDIIDITSNCRFSDCRHVTEPGCAVKRALEDGTLLKSRWELYNSLIHESNWAASKKTAPRIIRRQ